MALLSSTPMTTRLLALGALALTAACSDAPSAPRTALAPSAAPARGAALVRSSLVSQRVTVGDTVITVFEVGTDTKSPAGFDIGHASKIGFPLASGSICDPATSSYGPGTWNSPCQATKTPTRITARVWKNAQGKVATDFQPALRFVPGTRKPVVLTLKDPATASTHVDYCTPTGCVDESRADASLKTILDATNGFAHRPIKHFSGYSVVVDRADDGSGF